MTENKNPQGGYMRSLHKLEEKLYSPEIKLSGNEFKVLLYIRHNSIRWDKEEFEFSYGEISEKTGVQKRQLKKIVSDLVKKKIILKFSSSINNVANKNVMGLNPAYFGDLIEETARPKLSVIKGGKEEKLSTGVSNTAPPLVSNLTPGWGSIEHHQHHQEPLPEPGSGDLKNPSKEHIKKLFREKGDFFSQGMKGNGDGEMTKEEDYERRQLLRSQTKILKAQGIE